MRIAIFGLGYVGTVSGACFADMGHDVIGVDTQETKVAMVNAGEAPIVEELIGDLTRRVVADGRFRATMDAEEAVNSTELGLVSVGTPTAANGAPMLAAVDGVVGTIGDILARAGDRREYGVMIRSTIPPGCTQERLAPILEQRAGRHLGEDLHLTFNPEFLREGRSVRDFREPPFTIIGAETVAAFRHAAPLYEGIPAPLIHTPVGVAESIKILSNAFHAAKITFANEAGRLLKSCGVDARLAMDIFCRDTQLNVSKAYLRPGFAFGGSCLPKDVRAILSQARSANVELPMIDSLLASNKAHIDSATRLITGRGRRRVLMFGLSFKPGTDDLRESPLVALAEQLIGKGYELRIVDDHVQESRLLGKNRAFIETEIPHFAQLLTQDVVGAVVWAETIVVGHVTEAHRAILLANLAGKAVVDLAGVDGLATAGAADYDGICW